MSEEDLANLDLVELYDLLIRPDAPDAISMWPQTAGWIWVAALVLVALGVLVWALVARHRANAYRRAALVALNQAGDDPARIADVLRRTALSAFPRETVSQLHGVQWLAFLDQAAPGVKFASSDAGRVLAASPYRPQDPNKDLPAMAAQWIKSHRKAGPT
ncbi:DUF4381 domain-containing protein [Tateyamaria pelophila]|uniref:DUF4381 domain-containing protein n=1 Tax=Tateyamaria pelophila TaxID=328415 RepID=UPI001CBAECA7|nr:DUF4381 domain-containing protein [Tateyamaria pelophila]